MSKNSKNKITQSTIFQVVIISILLLLLVYQIVRAFSDSNSSQSSLNSNESIDISIEETSKPEPSPTIPIIKSSVDYNSNGIDDYSDILAGAKQEALDRPLYEDVYWAGGYPPAGTGVCTDVIWRAFKEAGYNLKEMIDKDISKYPWEYELTNGYADPNIDFRRVPNQKIFFSKYAVSLTINTDAVFEWQPGDIVVYGNRHIAIVSDIRNEDGLPYIIHNSDDHDEYEEDFLDMEDLSAHYRFDASKIPENVLIGYN